MIKAGQHVVHVVDTMPYRSDKSTVVLDALGLIDLTLTCSLVVLVIFSGYENFVSRMSTPTTAPTQPAAPGMDARSISTA